jgi:DNA (cytosine-5)-methyltransferase 1
MGFPDTFQIPVSDTQAYRQFGNSVAVPVIAVIAALLRDRLQTAVPLKTAPPRKKTQLLLLD